MKLISWMINSDECVQQKQLRQIARSSNFPEQKRRHMLRRFNVFWGRNIHLISHAAAGYCYSRPKLDEEAYFSILITRPEISHVVLHCGGEKAESRLMAPFAVPETNHIVGWPDPLVKSTNKHHAPQGLEIRKVHTSRG
jgi:hypothetical protein